MRSHNPRPPKARRARGADAARLVAAHVLIDVEGEGSFANLALPRTLREEQTRNRNFTTRDSAFASELVYGTIRQQGFIDFALAKHCSSPLATLDIPVLVSLRLGAYQLLFLRVSDHAAISESVELARSLAGEGPARFVNAVLRSLQREGREGIQDRVHAIGDEDARLAIEHSHPGWVVNAFREALTQRGIDQAELPDALAANNVAPEVTLVARPGLTTPAELSQEVEDVLGTTTRQGSISEYAVIMDHGDPGALPSVRAGLAAVQDEGSQFAATLLAQAPLDGPDDSWLDLCAGPGGKSALLGALGAQRGVTVVANEVNPRRAQLVERSVQALDNVQVRVEDGRGFHSEHPFDRVLVDAPCLGLGSLRRRPESRWRHSEGDLADLVSLQESLLESGISLTRPGGLIAWVTCSPHVRETLDRIGAALDQQPVELLDAASLAQEMVVEDLGLNQGEGVASKTVQLWPHRHGSDAMFIALLRRR